MHKTKIIKKPVDAGQLVLAAREYLLSRPGITEDILDAHLTCWKNSKNGTLNGIFQTMAVHAKNYGGMPNYIGDVDKLRDVLFGFNPKKTTTAYPTWKALCDEIRRRKLRLPSRMVTGNPRNSWVRYTKSVVSCAGFLSRFRSATDFHDFVESFYSNEYSKLALPLLLEKELFGYGFALACDFLKESGYPEFVKPDTHIKFIAHAAGITSSQSDYQVFKAVVAYCDANSLVPFEFDKLLWLIGSGNFYLNRLRVRTDRTEFVRFVQ